MTVALVPAVDCRGSINLFSRSGTRTAITARMAVAARRGITPSLYVESFELGILRRQEIQLRPSALFQVRVEECTDAVRGHLELTPPVDTKHSQQMQNATHELALEYRAVVTEREMI